MSTVLHKVALGHRGFASCQFVKKTKKCYRRGITLDKEIRAIKENSLLKSSQIQQHIVGATTAAAKTTIPFSLSSYTFHVAASSLHGPALNWSSLTYYQILCSSSSFVK